MAHLVRLTDREIDRVVRNVTEGRYREYVRSMFQIAIREKGSLISVSTLDDNLKDLPYIDRSVVVRMVRTLEEIYEEQQR